MESLLKDPKVAKKKGRRYVVAKIDVEALGVAKKVAALKGMTLADYLSELVLPAATRDLHSEIKKISRNEQGE